MIVYYNFNRNTQRISTGKICKSLLKTPEKYANSVFGSFLACYINEIGMVKVSSLIAPKWSFKQTIPPTP